MLDEFDLSDATRKVNDRDGKVLHQWLDDFLWDVSEKVEARAAEVNDEADVDRAISFGLNDASQFCRRSRKAIAVGWLPTKATCGRGSC